MYAARICVREGDKKIGVGGGDVMGDVLICVVTQNNLALSKIAVNSALQQQPPCDVMVIETARLTDPCRGLKLSPSLSWPLLSNSPSPPAGTRR